MDKQDEAILGCLCESVCSACMLCVWQPDRCLLKSGGLGVINFRHNVCGHDIRQFTHLSLLGWLMLWHTAIVPNKAAMQSRDVWYKYATRADATHALSICTMHTATARHTKVGRVTAKQHDIVMIQMHMCKTYLDYPKPNANLWAME